MTISKTQENDKIILALDGRLDTTSAPQLQDVLIPAFEETSSINIDLTNLAYISSAGLRVILAGQKTAQAKNASMTVSGASEEILEVFTMTGFSEILTII